MRVVSRYLLYIEKPKFELLMLTIVYIILPVILAGLGFITYQHPAIARKIISALFFLDAAVLIIASLSFGTEQSAYSKSIEIVSNKMIDTIPSIKLTPKNVDSAQKVMNALQERHELKKDFLTKIKKEISTKRTESYELIDSIRFWCFISFGAIMIFLLLSFLFDDLHNKK